MAVTDTWESGESYTAADGDLVARAINGSGWLQPCQLATVGTETFTISSGNVTVINGSTLDGQSVSVGYRVLVKDAPASSGTGSPLSAEPGNGVYDVSAVATNISLTRVYEMSNTPPTPYAPAGLVVEVTGGTANGGQLFNVVSPSTPATFTYGSGNIQWRPVGYQAGTGLVVSGSTIALNSTAQTDLGLAATSLQSASGVLGASGGNVTVNTMATGKVIAGNGGTPAIVTVGGDVTIDGSGNVTIGANKVGLSKLATLAANSVIGNTGGGSSTPSAIPVAAGATVNAIALRDGNANLVANSFISGATSTATAGTTTTLTATSTEVQQFTGTATQTVVTPDATTLSIGQQYLITNRSTGVVTLNANGGSLLQSMVAGSQTYLTLINNSSAAGTWDVDYTISGLMGTVTAISIASSNGFAGTSSGGATPTLTLTTTITGVLKGNGTAIVAATSGTDFAPATSGSSILKGNGSGGFSNAASGTDYAPATATTSALKGNGSGGFSAAVLNDVGAPTANYALGGTYTFTGVPTPVTSDSAVNKGYVDALFQGASGKFSAEAATTGSETFTVTSGSVAQISGTSVDGVSPNVNDYILVKDAPASTGAGSANSTQPGNGLYQVTANTTNLNLTRATALSGSNSPVGAYVFVSGGTANGGNGWIVTTPSTSGSFTYGTNNLHWTQFTGAGQITTGAGLSKTGNTLSIENSGVLTVAHGGTGAASLTGLVKGNGTSAFTAATSGTDFAPATTGSSILKASSGGFANATAGTDYAPATSGSSILKGNGSGGFSSATSGTDYAPATSGTTVLKGNGSGGFASASFSDLATPTASFAMGGYGITGAANPTNAQDLATKIYVDSESYHPSCRVATTGTETFTISGGTCTQINGTMIDGVSVSIGDRVLIKDAPATSGTGSVLSNQSGNGIYVITGNTTNLTVSRVSDMSSGGAIGTPAGSSVAVMAGGANAATAWTIASPSSSAAFTYGSSTMQWTPVINTGNVLVRSGNTVSVGSMSTGQAIIGNAGTPTITTLSGDVTVGATGVTAIGSGVVTLAKQANLAAMSVIGNTSGSSATPSAVSLLATATAGAVALRDSNANLLANSFIANMATTATAAGFTTLTVSSAPFQQFTGTTTQQVILPNATTMTNGQAFTVANRSTGVVSVYDAGATLLKALSAGSACIFTLISNSGFTGTWDVQYSATSGATGFTTTATAAGTTTLTSSSTPIQVFTGTTTQIVALPTTSIAAGAQYSIINNSTGLVTVNASGGSTVVVLPGGTSTVVTAVVATPTTAANWECQFGGVAVTSGKELTVNNSMTLAAVDGATFNFGGTPTTITSGVACTTTQTVVASYAIPANTLVAGQAFQVEAFGTQVTTGNVTYYVCLGSAGTNADTAIYTSTATSVTSLLGGTIEGMVTIRSTGSSGTCIAHVVSVLGTTTAVAPTTTATTINTTGQLYLTIQAKASAGTHTVQQAFISVCQV